MSHFIENEHLTIHPMQREDGTWIWVTSRPFLFIFGAYTPTAAHIVVPAGFETDLGSIPWWGRWLLNPSEPGLAQAYVLHDFINHQTHRRPPGEQVWSSQSAAAILYDAMRIRGAAVWKARLIFSAVLSAIAPEEW